jgi:hypothetical protein
MTRTDESTRGGGWKALRGNDIPRRTSKSRNTRRAPGSLPSAHRRTTARCSTMSAAVSRECGPSNVRSRAADREYGGFATTRNGRLGNRSEPASTCSTRTSWPANRLRSRCTRSGCSSTARTRAPAASRCTVNAPSPAPISRTSSPGRRAASATTRAAHSSTSGCHPQPPRDNPEAGTTDQRQEGEHAPDGRCRFATRQPS